MLFGRAHALWQQLSKGTARSPVIRTATVRKLLKIRFHQLLRGRLPTWMITLLYFHLWLNELRKSYLLLANRNKFKESTLSITFLASSSYGFMNLLFFKIPILNPTFFWLWMCLLLYSEAFLLNIHGEYEMLPVDRHQLKAEAPQF